MAVENVVFFSKRSIVIKLLVKFSTSFLSFRRKCVAGCLHRETTKTLSTTVNFIDLKPLIYQTEVFEIDTSG